MLNIEIREGVAGDFPALARIISSSNAWTCFGINYDIALGIFEKMEDKIYVAVCNGQIIGFITIRVNGVGNIGAYIRMVAVEEKFRGQGVGRRLIDYAGRIASDNLPNLFLICSVENLDAQRFYKKMGFVQVGILNDLVIPGHDEILYRKSFGTLR